VNPQRLRCDIIDSHDRYACGESSVGTPVYSACPQCGRPKRQLVACQHCGYIYLGATIHRGRSGTRPALTRETPELETPVGTRYTEGGRSAERRSFPVRARTADPAGDNRKATTCAESRPGFVAVYSKRGKRVDDDKRYDECGRVCQPVWRFWETDRGMVYLCKDCKPKVLARSARTDALDYRVPGDFYRR
jgi:hypothetical protein